MSKEIVYIKKHGPSTGAGFWIYQGYFKAWENLGFEVRWYEIPSDIKTDNPFYIMTNDSLISETMINLFSQSEKTFLFVQPGEFPKPWGEHPNFVSACQKQFVAKINEMENVFKWTWCDSKKYHQMWKNVYTMPLAFDSIGYRGASYQEKLDFDVCFIGGLANNGFNEKVKIMNEVMGFLEKSELKCGFFINKNVPHNLERDILFSSKVCLNVHDNYQRVLGFDTNERTFKSLGLGGCLISDEVGQVTNIFPDVYTDNSPQNLLEQIRKIIRNPEVLEKIKTKNRKTVEDEHTYIKRVEKFLSL